jgi:hypothetical protein
MGSVFLACPELALDEEESKMLGTAAADVAKHYDVIVDEKTQAWISLSFALSAVYGPRIFAVYARMKEPKPKQAAKAEDENVVNLRGPVPAI